MTGLTRDERNQLYLIAWQGAELNPRWLKPDVAHKLAGMGFLTALGEDKFAVTPQGVDVLSPEARAALTRPKDYHKLSSQRQWEIDKGLGILDWDGD